jgi:arylsulfatase A
MPVVPQSRRQFLRSAALASLPWTGLAAARRRLPNIVIILADDLGYGDIGAYNPESKIPTPHVDRMAREGIRFTDAHTPCAVCSPTRYGLLTGRYPWRTELKQQVLWPFDKPLIEKGRLTMGSMLKQRGYHTACFGKWHLGFDWPTSDGSRLNDTVKIGEQQRPIRDAFAKKIQFDKPVREGPITRGFDYYFGVDLPNFPPYAFIENDRLLTQPTAMKPDGMFGWPGPMTPGWRLESVLPEITRRTVRHIEERAKQNSPYFVYMPLTGPHQPVAPDDPYLGKSKAGKYGDFVHQVDWCVGEVLEAIRKSGTANDTIVIFTSDNGPENLTYPLFPEFGHSSAGPLRGNKRMLWEGGHRVPFVAWGPGRVPAGQTEKEIICLTDLMASFAALVDYKLPNDAAEDSYDIRAALFGQKRSRPIRQATVHHSYNNEYGLRQGDWVLVESANGGGGAAEPAWWRERHGIKKDDQPAALYHIKEDLAETKNLYAQYPDRVKEMHALLEKYKTEDRSVPRR